MSQEVHSEFDILKSLKVTELPVLDKGHVRIVDVMPRMVPEGKTGDFAIVQAARVSYGHGTKTVNEDRGLIRYLLRHNHGTPLEMAVVKLHMKLPIFVARQFARHRISSTNEVSRRYSEMTDDFYIPKPEEIRSQSTTNKQGGDATMSEEDAYDVIGTISECSHDSYNMYKALADDGVAREQARMILPVNAYTDWYWQMNLRSLLHMLSLRCDSHAQKETRDYADAIRNIVEPIFPHTFEAWEDYDSLRGGMLLTKQEIELISQTGEPVLSARDHAEFVSKLERLGNLHIIE